MQTPAPFEYERATSVEGAIASLQRLGSEARIIAGGHSLLPMMKLRLANPEHLIDINDLTELAYIREEGGEIRIGALTRHVDLLKSELLAEHFPLFRDAEHVIADPVVRNRGTIGGSLCQADAAEDLSAVCSAVKAKVVIRGTPAASASSAWTDFHVGPYMTAVGDGEMLTEVRLPLRPGAGSAHEKVERRAGDWAIAAASAARLDRRRHDRRRGHRAQRGRARRRSTSRAPRSCCAARRRRRSCSRRRARSPSEDCSPTAGRPRAGRLQAPSRRRPHQTRPAPRDGARAAPGGLTHERLDDDQRRAGLARRRAAPAARALHPRDARPDRHPLGLRHVQLRRLRGADGRRAGQVVHDPGRDVRGPRDPHRRVARGRRPSSTRSSRASTSATRSSAGSARRGC